MWSLGDIMEKQVGIKWKWGAWCSISGTRLVKKDQACLIDPRLVLVRLCQNMEFSGHL